MSKSRRNVKAGVTQPVRTNDSFQNATANLGWGTNNQSSASQYALSYQSRNRINLEAAYRGSWVVRAAVDAMPEDMTRCGIEMSGLEPEDISLIERDMMRLAIWDALCDDGKWANLYGGCLAVMLIDGQDFATPLRVETIAKGQFKGLLILDRWMVSPPVGEVVTEFGPDMGKPVYYNVIADYAAIPKAKIHYSRVIRLDGMDLPFYQRVAENGWGLSVLEPMWDRLIAFDSASVGAGQLIYKAHLRTMTIEGLREVIAMGGPALAGLKAQIEFTRFAQTNEGITLVDGKDKFEAHTYAFSGLSDMLTQFAQQLCGALGMPFTRLFGQSPTGLGATGEGEMKQWEEKVRQQQERRLRNPLHRLLSVMSMSTLGKPLPDGFGFEFRSLQEMNEAEKAEIAVKKVDAVTKAVDAGVQKASSAMKDLKASAPVTGLFGSITDEDISEAEEQEKNAPPPGELDMPDVSELGGNQTKDSRWNRFFRK
jgi:phage-related protein (TIGR01555 family)